MDMPKTVDTIVDKKYVEDAVNQSMAAYRNLCLLAIRKRADLTAMCSAVNKTIRQYMTKNRLLLSVEFDSIAYISALAGELGKSLISILYMGQKEQDELLHRAVSSITINDVLNYKEPGDEGTLAAGFTVILPVTGNAQDTPVSAGYLLTFRKNRPQNEAEYRYTMYAEYFMGQDTSIKISPFMSDRVMIRSESSGIVADFVERIFLMKPEVDSKQGGESQKDEQTDIYGASKSKDENGTGPSFNTLYTSLKNGLDGKEIPENKKILEKKEADVNNESTNKPDQKSPLKKGNLPEKENPSDNNTSVKKAPIKTPEKTTEIITKEKTGGINTDGETNEKSDAPKSPPAKKVYKIFKSKTGIMKYKTSERKYKHIITADDKGKEHSIPVVVDYNEMRIYIAEEMFQRYGEFIKKKMKLQ